MKFEGASQGRARFFLCNLLVYTCVSLSFIQAGCVDFTSRVPRMPTTCSSLLSDASVPRATCWDSGRLCSPGDFHRHLCVRSSYSSLLRMTLQHVLRLVLVGVPPRVERSRWRRCVSARTEPPRMAGPLRLCAHSVSVAFGAALELRPSLCCLQSLTVEQQDQHGSW